MQNLSDTRKLSIKRINHEILKELEKRDFINKPGDGFLIAVTHALKNSLPHDPIDIARRTDGNGDDMNLEDADSFKSINEIKTVLKAIYPMKYNNNNNQFIEYPNRLLSVLADAGLNDIRTKCTEDGKINIRNFLEII